MTEEWSINLREQLAEHRGGLVLKLSGGEVMDIVRFPKGLATRELPRLLKEGVKAYQAAERKTSQPSASGEGPRKPTLSLKRRSQPGR